MNGDAWTKAQTKLNQWDTRRRTERTGANRLGDNIRRKMKETYVMKSGMESRGDHDAITAGRGDREAEGREEGGGDERGDERGDEGGEGGGEGV